MLVSDDAIIHEFTQILAETVVGAGSKVGSYCSLSGCEIGKSCNIQAFCFIPTGVEIKDGVFIGPRVTFCNDKYPPSHGKWREERHTIVGKGAVIGAGAIILPHIHIGEGAIIGAGALVTKDVKPYAVAYGHPAKIKGYVKNKSHHY